MLTPHDTARDLPHRSLRLDTTNPALWDVYAQGLTQLYAAEPGLDGILNRIGEAGRVYDVERQDY